MRRQGSGFGFVVLLVVVVVVLFLATRAFKSTLPAASAIVKPPAAAEDTADSGKQQGGESIRPAGRIPDLKDTKQGTDAHAARVKDALEQTQQ